MEQLVDGMDEETAIELAEPAELMMMQLQLQRWPYMQMSMRL